MSTNDTFTNVANLDFALETNRQRYSAALAALQSDIDGELLFSQPIIDGEFIETKDLILREDPAQRTQVLGKVHLADLEVVDFALSQLSKASHRWRCSAVTDRLSYVRTLAQLMEEQRCRLAALMIRESAKPWMEADADVSEAIDFCLYYADQLEELALGYEQNLPGQLNHTHIWPRGKVAVIAPWNFPLAILCGMSVAALITGNQTIIKPAEQSSLIAFQFCLLLQQAGFPKHSFAFLPGKGELVGQALVESTAVDMICFTGSKAVGLHINATAAQQRPGQTSVKKVVAEMGGKNAIIVDSDADLDAAVAGILKSAFGFSGQKCSACSRVIVVGEHYNRICERLKEAARDLTIGAPQAPETQVGPLIDRESQERILTKIAEFEKQYTLLFKGQVPDSGHFVPVTIFKDVPKNSELWQAEFFAPLLAVQRANSFTEAVVLASESEFALTGAVFSRHPEHIEYARSHLEVGNLYINQGCTGALVGRQPFGGFKLSGCGAKAGGRNYLLQFVNERTVTENTMRKGYTPELA